ncbi:MAG: hypothetical protein IJP02_01760 [Oscillospiraceae bacterium]|nr:hypothetical protein [Oscillospiraceae bacterium]
MARNSYDGYRGRTRARKAAGVAAGAVVILLVLVVVGLLIGQRYIVYTDEGVHLDIPFLRGDEQTPPALSGVSVEIIPGPEEEAHAAAPYTVRAVFMSVDELLSGGAQAVTRRGANTVVLDMKHPDGTLGYTSGLTLAQNADAPAERIDELIGTLHEADIRAVARVSCFRDDRLGRREEYALLTNSGYCWNYDPVGLYWISAGRPAVREYVADVVKELALLGFDEVLLEDWGYPTQGELGWLRRGEDYSPDRLNTAVDAFADLVCQGTEGTDTTVSFYVPAGVLDGTDPYSGITPELLARMEGRIWLKEKEAADLHGLAVQLGMEERTVFPAPSLDQDQNHIYLIR